MSTVVFGDELLRVLQIFLRFPGVVSSAISLPTDQVHELLAPPPLDELAIQNAVDFVLKLPLQFNRFRRGWQGAIDIITLPGRELVDVEDRVDAREVLGEFELVVEVADALDNLVGA